MLYRPLTSAFRNSPPSLTPFSSLPLSRTVASRCSQPAIFRSISSSIPSYRTFNSSKISSRPFPKPFACSPRRSFSSSGRKSYGFGNQPYKRFNNPQSQSFHWYLLSRAKPHHFVIIGLGISGFYIYNTDVVEMTGRRRFNCLKAEHELAMGRESYEEVLRSERGNILPVNHGLSKSVRHVLRRLVPHAPIKGAIWEVHVIASNEMNAFVLPGGKVFVHTGILPVCGDEEGLAAVLGHEIAHVVAHHPAERMSNSLLTIAAVFLISMKFDISGHLPSIFLNLIYGLPNSRTQEAEADTMGLLMMSKACFNPEAAVRLWSRMQQLEKETPPQFLSTHPSSYNRTEALQDELYKAQAIYEDSGCHAMGGYMPGFRQAYNEHTW